MQEASKIESPTNLLSNLQNERILMSQDSASKEEQNAWFEKFREGWEHQQMVEDYKLDVPLIPSLNFENYQHFINHWEGWLNFRNSYTEHNLENNMK